jgi:hypothetical protein
VVDSATCPIPSDRLRKPQCLLHIGAVSAANARDAAEAWIASAGLPADLSGRIVQLVAFTSDEHCRFFYPRRALIWQQQVNTYISRALRGRRAKIARVTLTPDDYRAWLKNEGHADTEAARRQFADQHQRLLD